MFLLKFDCTNDSHLFKASQSTPKSTLPPEIIMPTLLQFFQAGFFLKQSDKTAASPMAPLGSTATFKIS